MDLNPTGRFSSRVADYIRYRPSYPDAIIPLLERECGLRPEARIADIGSGTGLLAQLFLRFGFEVCGVEPNPDMRLAGDRLLAAESRFHSLDGRAEHTGFRRTHSCACRPGSSGRLEWQANQRKQRPSRLFLTA
jgi:SAM-dependent methyltransferase